MRSFRNLIFLMVMVASLASATVLQTYTDRSTWEAATTSRVDIDFDSLGLGVGGYQSFSTVAGLTTGGLTLVGVLDVNQYFLWALNPPLGANEDFGSGTLLRGPELRSTSYLSVVLPASITSFAVDLMSFDPGAASFRIELDGVDVGLVIGTQGRPTRTFFGVTTDSSISEVRIILNSGIQQNTQGLFDNFAYGAAGTSGGGGTTGGEPPPETPEVATLLSVGSGLLMLRWMRRRQPAGLPSAA